MAVMVPNSISPDVKSDAEKKIFSWFQNAEGTDDWIVLHSLGISRHQHVIFGETDFLVLAPGRGMFALEVKGGRVRCEQGMWTFINRYDEETKKVRSPFQQAWEGIYSIKNAIRDKLDDSHQYLNGMVYGIGVMFPDIRFDTVGIDYEKYQIFDIDDGKSVRKFIERNFNGTMENLRSRGIPDEEIMLPSPDDVMYLLDILRGDFDRDIPLKIKQKYTEEKFLELTNEQALCIEQMEDNPRILVHGTAGTGKTILAIETVKKSAGRGEKVALFCFNHQLGEWLRDYFSDCPSELQPVYVGTFHNFMTCQLREYDIPTIRASGSTDKNNYYRNILPDEFLKNLSDSCRKFDRIVIDEAQDLISDKYLDVIDLSLNGGLRYGSWSMFGDFLMQSIYTEQMSESQYFELLQERTTFALFHLKRNCRNTRNICREIENVAGVPEIPAFPDKHFETPYVDYRTYCSMEDQKACLVTVITELLDKNIQQEDIVILSPRIRSKSVVSLLDNIAPEDYSVRGKGNIRFSTVHAFKGLESPVVILTDIENYADEKMLYVGLSRATFDLHVLETESAALERASLVVSRRTDDGR